MYFELLRGRLIAALRNHLGNGLLTERSLARRAGVSQPHIHHILKGERALSPEIADRILRALRMTVLDLLETTELKPGNAEAGRPGPAWESGAPAAGWSPLGSPESSGVSARESWPPRGRFREPGALPPPN